jgi:hypothetical protein
MRHLGVLTGTAILSAAALPALAHHSFGAEFDRNAPVHLEGKVVRFEWVNPHSWLVIDVTKEDGTIEQWRVEGGAPSALLRRGWNRNSVPTGTQIVVDGFMAKDGSPRANARDIVFPDGTSLFIGSSGTGAPYEETRSGADAPKPAE